jgi:CRISPR-associated protein Csb1
LSEIGHGHIAPNAAHGGVTVREVRRRAWVSFAGLERLRFGDAPAEAATLARATLAALALVGDRLTFGRPSVWLRSGCDLTLVSETVAFEVAGGGQEPVSVSAADAVAAFTTLRGRAAEAGIVMFDDAVAVTPTRQLREAMVFARTSASGEAE